MKAIALLSGGLDSTLAIKLVKDQGVEVIALNFTSPFCTCTSKNSSCSTAALAAKNLGIQLKVIAKGMDYFKMVEDPKFGYGSAMNPCIDCRVYILKKAKEIMKQEGASFIISGEVVGQRPKSQKKDTLRCIEKEADVDGILLRPLSAKLLPVTIPEKMGWVDREKLMDISGRGRKTQMAMAENAGIYDYPCPAGGCLLTDKNIARRLKDLFKHKKEYTIEDIKLLRWGRHIRLDAQQKLILARDEDEGNKLMSVFERERDILFRCEAPKGPVAVLKGAAQEIDQRVFAIIHYYSDAADNEALTISYEGLTSGAIVHTYSLDKQEVESLTV